uniref:NADH:ubiquinone reductase (H(+)-translocating) n=1 Tax=Jaculus jaculus TaxID=51337 RepID=A0A8C5LIS8_JACJA
LLHSITIFVAGVVLLARFYLILGNEAIKAQCHASALSLPSSQTILRKIVTFPKSSQVGLMVVTLGIDQPYLAYLYICTRTFFKAILFLCSGSIIHNLIDEQDIRKIGGLAKAILFTTTAVMTTSLALVGTSFLTGFYSKDLIIETINTSYTNA